MPRTPAKLCFLALLLLPAKASLAAADQTLQIPFEYGSNRNAILLHVRINDRPVILILDTGSAHTTLQPGILGMNPAELMPTRPGPSGNSGAADAIDREVALQVGDRIWKKWPVMVADLSQVLSAHSEKPDGILGLDFLQEFSSVVLDLKGKTITLSTPANQEQRLSFGNLRKLNLGVNNGHYILNDTELERVSGNSVELATSDRSFKVRGTFLKNMLLSNGQPVAEGDKDLMSTWASLIPLVREILKQKDPIGSLKPVIYNIVEPKGRTDLELQEELVLLWSADPADDAKIGDTTLMPPMPFPGQVIDVQYRGLKGGVDKLIGKIILQLLYIRDKSDHFLLGGFVIVSKPNGEYEFYSVPPSVLDQIVIERR